MESTNRLAAYLADELTSAERRALEVELAHDPALRATLRSMRRADNELERLAPANPPEGFDERLHRTISVELAHLLDPASTTGRADATQRAPLHRTARSPRVATVTPLRSWMPALAGVAAAVAAVAGIGLAVTNLVPTDDLVVMASNGELGFDMATERSMPEAALASPDVATDLDMPGPAILDVARSIEDKDLMALLHQPELTLVASQLHEETDIAATAQRWIEFVQNGITAALGLSGTESAPPSTAPKTDTRTEGFVVEPGPLRVTRSSPSAIDPGDLRAISRCLQTLAGEPAIPVFIELATDGAGQAVIVLGLVLVDATVDADNTARSGLPQVRVVDRATCAVLTQISA